MVIQKLAIQVGEFAFRISKTHCPISRLNVDFLCVFVFVGFNTFANWISLIAIALAISVFGTEKSVQQPRTIWTATRPLNATHNLKWFNRIVWQKHVCICLFICRFTWKRWRSSHWTLCSNENSLNLCITDSLCQTNFFFYDHAKSIPFQRFYQWPLNEWWWW